MLQKARFSRNKQINHSKNYVEEEDKNESGGMTRAKKYQTFLNTKSLVGGPRQHVPSSQRLFCTGLGVSCLCPWGHYCHWPTCYIYIYIYMYVCMYVCMYACMHVCMYIYREKLVISQQLNLGCLCEVGPYLHPSRI